MRCPKSLDVKTEDADFGARDLEADGTACTGAGTVKLKMNPSDGGRISDALREEEDDRDDSYEAAQAGAMTCGRLPIPARTEWIFFSPEDEFKINPSKVLGGTRAVLAAGVAGDVEFGEDENYLFIGESCLYKQQGRLEEANDGDSACFPAAATVELESGARKTMEDLSIGDRVAVRNGRFSPVFMFTHKLSDTEHAFVTLRTASGARLALTAGHYLYANGALVAAGGVRVGDELALGGGGSSAVVAVRRATARGLYNPQTVAGDVVVDGVLASTYTTAVEPALAHALLAPFRWLNVFGLQTTVLESGGGALAGVAPRGEAVF